MAGEENQNQVGEGGSEGGEDRAAIESRAKEMGWAPKDQWRGAEADWIDADVFIERGESIMPILRANNRRLEEEVRSLRAQQAQTQQLLRESTATLEALKEANTEISRERARTKKTELAAAVREAREAGDVERETELQTELTEITTELRQADAEAKDGTRKPNGQESREAPTATQDFTQEPWFKTWHAENPWFGSDQQRTKYAAFVAQEVKQAHPELRHGEFLEKVREEVEKTFGPPQQERRRSQTVEGGRQSGDSDTDGGKSYADLPQSAKQACDRQAARLVGKGKAFQTMEAWRKNYAQKYFAE